MANLNIFEFLYT